MARYSTSTWLSITLVAVGQVANAYVAAARSARPRWRHRVAHQVAHVAPAVNRRAFGGKQPNEIAGSDWQ